METNLVCPRCLKSNLVKCGSVWSGRNKRQQWLCTNCGHKTIKPLKLEELKKIVNKRPSSYLINQRGLEL